MLACWQEVWDGKDDVDGMLSKGIARNDRVFHAEGFHAEAWQEVWAKVRHGMRGSMTFL